MSIKKINLKSDNWKKNNYFKRRHILKANSFWWVSILIQFFNE